jgi:hypothetical protein
LTLLAISTFAGQIFLDGTCVALSSSIVTDEHISEPVRILCVLCAYYVHMYVFVYVHMYVCA